MDSPLARVIAFYLPQYHPLAENDEWWGRGFTEWTNTAKAKPLFPGHYQPHIPADLGFYDLRLPETRAAQAQLARAHGVEAFCYYHYWFAGRRILERPFDEVLASGQPDFPFCLSWANQTWSGIWHGAPQRILIEQTYPGLDDHRRHFDVLLPAFMDPRYVRVDGRPLFVVYNPRELPESRRVLDLWRELAMKAGLTGLFLVGEHFESQWDARALGYDAAVHVRLPEKRRKWFPWSQPIPKLQSKFNEWRQRPDVHRYEDVIDRMIAARHPQLETFPCVIPNWDNSPRSGANGLVLHGSTPELFRRHLKRALDSMSGVPFDRRLVFVKSWNEWAEGNHLEPDLRFGRRYLEVLREELSTEQAARRVLHATPIAAHRQIHDATLVSRDSRGRSSWKMNTLLKRTAKTILRTVAPGANPGVIAQRFEEMPRKLKKRLRSGTANTVRRLRGAPDGFPLPPGRLMFLVQGTTNAQEFLTDGRGTATAVLDVLESSGLTIDSSKSVLDFGCGCGRVIRHVHSMTGARCFGSDYNPLLVDWCKENLRFAQFGVNGAAPPLPYANDQFDVVYALSVFTHFPEELQAAWMSELCRVLKPGGHLLMTTHGESFLPYMSEEDRQTFRAGRLVVRADGAVGSNPFFAAHPPEYVRSHAPSDLAIVNFAPETRRRGEPPSRLCWQDGYVLAKRMAPAGVRP